MTLKKLRMKSVCILVLCTFVINLLTSCGGGGGASQKPVTITLDNLDTVYAQQQIATAKVANFTLTNDTYQATIDGSTPVTLTKTSGSSFAWLIPILSDGNHILQLTIGGQNISIPFSTQKVAASQSADTLISNLVPNTTSYLDAEIAFLSGQSGQEAKIVQMQKMKNDLITVQAQISTLSDEQKNIVASFIQQNLSTFDQVGKSVIKSTSKTVLQLVRSVAAEVVVIALSISVIGAPGIGQVLGTIGFVTGFAKFLIDARELIRSCTDFIKLTMEKLTTADDSFVKNSPKAANKLVYSTTSDILSFADKITNTYTIKTTYTLTSSFMTYIQDVKNKILGLPNVILSALPSDISAWAGSATLSSSGSQNSPASTYSILSISDININYKINVSVSGDIELTFNFITQTSSTTPVPFTFTLLDSRDGHTTVVSATLKPATIDHIKVSAPLDSVHTAGTLDLTASAYADVAETIEIPSVASDYTWSVASNLLSANNLGLVVNGKYTAGYSLGEVTILARHKTSNITGQKQITVSDGTISLLSYEPAGLNNLGQIGYLEIYYSNYKINIFDSITNSTVSKGADIAGFCYPYLTGMNDSGQVSGFKKCNGTSSIISTAFKYENGIYSYYGGEFQRGGVVINNNGIVAASNENKLTIYSNGTEKTYTTNASVIWPKHINDRGQVVGSMFVYFSNIYIEHAFLFKDEQFYDLGAYLRAYSINNSGQIVGCYAGDANVACSSPFLYENGSMKNIENLPGLEYGGAYDINDLGLIVGYSATAVSTNINSIDTNSRAFIYKNGTTYDLNSLYPTKSDLVFYTATKINNKGQIIGSASAPYNGTQSFLITP